MCYFYWPTNFKISEKMNSQSILIFTNHREKAKTQAKNSSSGRVSYLSTNQSDFKKPVVNSKYYYNIIIKNNIIKYYILLDRRLPLRPRIARGVTYQFDILQGRGIVVLFRVTASNNDVMLTRTFYGHIVKHCP